IQGPRPVRQSLIRICPGEGGAERRPERRRGGGAVPVHDGVVLLPRAEQGAAGPGPLAGGAVLRLPAAVLLGAVEVTGAPRQPVPRRGAGPASPVPAGRHGDVVGRVVVYAEAVGGETVPRSPGNADAVRGDAGAGGEHPQL